MSKGPIVFTSDFGLRDPYVAQVKAVIHRINPNARIYDLTHLIRPFCITCGSYVLYTSIDWFEPKTIFLVVVDPGVGGSRKPLIMRGGEYFFVGPDNGVFWPLIERFGVSSVSLYVINIERLGIPHVSRTFHGRDVFAPAAAYLSLNRKPSEIGEEIDAGSLVKSRLFEKKVSGNESCFRVIYVDRFGNIVLSASNKHFALPSEKTVVVVRRVRDGFVSKAIATGSFSLVEPGSLALYINSLGFLELSMNMGNIYKKYNYRIGDWVCLRSLT